MDIINKGVFDFDSDSKRNSDIFKSLRTAQFLEEVTEKAEYAIARQDDKFETEEEKKRKVAEDNQEASVKVGTSGMLERAISEAEKNPDPIEARNNLLQAGEEIGLVIKGLPNEATLPKS